MYANYHTHTPLCRHAQGTPEEYVQGALISGIRILGFSDHAPQFFPGTYYSHMRMFPRELNGYAEEIRKLQKEYAGRMEIHLGVEVEYYPDIFPQLLVALKAAGIEYMLLGQHWCGNEMGEPYNGRPTEDVSLLEKYCDQCIEAMKTGLFTYLAHPDLLHLVGDDKLYQEQIRRICRASNETQTPLEINLLGFRSNRHYPDPRFWEIAGEENCQVVLGMDAHAPEEFSDTQGLPEAMAIVEKYNLQLLDTVPLRKI